MVICLDRVRTESAGIKMLTFKGIGPGKPWKSPGILK